MKFFLFSLFFLYVSSFANENMLCLQKQDTTIQSQDIKDTINTQDSAILAYHSNSQINTAIDTTVPKVYKKRIVAPITMDSLITVDSLAEDDLLEIDTMRLLSKFTLHHFIPFYVVPNDSIHDKNRYAGERRIQNNNYSIYIYAYIFLFLLAICINIFQAINGNQYNKHTTLKSDIRRFSKLNTYFHLIVLILEVLLSIGLAAFLNITYIEIFGNETQNFVNDVIHFILPTSTVCFIFLLGKHIITYIIQNLFLSRKDRFVVLYFYKNMLIHLTSLAYIATCITFFIDNHYYKLYTIQIAIAIGILIYLYALLNVLRNLSKTFLRTFIGSFVYIITLEIIPYLLFFKFLYTYHFFIK